MLLVIDALITLLDPDILCEVQSLGGHLNVGWSYDGKLKRRIKPRQSVGNKTLIEKLPNEFQSTRNLERTFLSNRILFKKVKIMLKD